MAPRVIQGTVYLDDQTSVDGFLDGIGGCTEIALDTEGASFHRFLDRIYLLQISAHERSGIIDPLHTGKLPKLGVLLEDRSVQVVFHDADYDLSLIHI